MGAEIIEAVARFRPSVIQGGKLDTAGDMDLRRSRREAWRKAELATEFYAKLHELSWMVERAWEADIGAAEPYVHLKDRQGHICNAVRNAMALQILTPAPDQLAIRWKRKAISCRSLLTVEPPRE
jgi:hypothetical protein